VLGGKMLLQNGKIYGILEMVFSVGVGGCSFPSEPSAGPLPSILDILMHPAHLVGSAKGRVSLKKTLIAIGVTVLLLIGLAVWSRVTGSQAEKPVSSAAHLPAANTEAPIASAAQSAAPVGAPAANTPKNPSSAGRASVAASSAGAVSAGNITADGSSPAGQVDPQPDDPATTTAAQPTEPTSQPVTTKPQEIISAVPIKPFS
jgi:hypothetical protein